jgi:hypothetical protein
MAGIGDPWHSGDPRGQTRQETADRHVGMHEVGFFIPQDGDQGLEGADVRDGRQAADERNRDNSKTLGADVIQQRAFGTGTDDLVATRTDRPHQRQQKMPQRKIDVGDFDNFHRRRAKGHPARSTLLSAHFTCCGPSAKPVSTICSPRLGSAPPR